jgi:hypothetical protein
MAIRKAYKEAVQLVGDDGVRISGRTQYTETADGSNVYVPEFAQHGEADVDLSTLEAAAAEIQNNIGDRTDGSNENSLIGLSKRVYGILADTLAIAVAAIMGLLEDRLPAALDADGGIKTHVQNLPATQPVSSTQLPAALGNNGGLKVAIVDGGAGGGGGGGAATIADGADVALGATTDAEAAGNGSLIAIVKRIRTLLGSLAGVVTAGGAILTCGIDDATVVWEGSFDFAAGAAANTVLTQTIPAPAIANRSRTQTYFVEQIVIAAATITGIITPTIRLVETIGGQDYLPTIAGLGGLSNAPATAGDTFAHGNVSTITRLWTNGNAIRIEAKNSSLNANAMSLYIRIRRM